jgi:ABC-type sugar transport system substrate-binding protein
VNTGAKGSQTLTRRVFILSTSTALFVAPQRITRASPPKLARRDSYTIGLALGQATSPWDLDLVKYIKEEAQRRGYKLIYTDAHGSPSKQGADINSMISQGADVILVEPREYQPIKPAIRGATLAGIPVIVLGMPLSSVKADDPAIYIGPDFVEQGRLAARWILANATSDGKIIELAGPAESQASGDIAKGFREVMAQQPRVRLIPTSSNYDFHAARASTAAVLDAHSDANVVFTHNGDMALGAVEAISDKNKRPGKDVLVVTANAYTETNDRQGTIAAAVRTRADYGPLVFDTINRMARGEVVAPVIPIASFVINGASAPETCNTSVCGQGQQCCHGTCKPQCN